MAARVRYPQIALVLLVLVALLIVPMSPTAHAADDETLTLLRQDVANAARDCSDRLETEWVGNRNPLEAQIRWKLREVATNPALKSSIDRAKSVHGFTVQLDADTKRAHALGRRSSLQVAQARYHRLAAELELRQLELAKKH